MYVQVVLIRKYWFKRDTPADAKRHMEKTGKGSCTKKRPAAHTDQLRVPAPPPRPDTAWR